MLINELDLKTMKPFIGVNWNLLPISLVVLFYI